MVSYYVGFCGYIVCKSRQAFGWCITCQCIVRYSSFPFIFVLLLLLFLLVLPLLLPLLLRLLFPILLIYLFFSPLLKSDPSSPYIKDSLTLLPLVSIALSLFVQTTHRRRLNATRYPFDQLLLQSFENQVHGHLHDRTSHGKISYYDTNVNLNVIYSTPISSF